MPLPMFDLGSHSQAYPSCMRASHTSLSTMPNKISSVLRGSRHAWRWHSLSDGCKVGSAVGRSVGDVDGHAVGEVVGLDVGASVVHVPPASPAAQPGAAPAHARDPMQSAATQHARPVAHPGHPPPPQSTSVSRPPRMPSVQLASEGAADGDTLGRALGEALTQPLQRAAQSEGIISQPNALGFARHVSRYSLHGVLVSATQ